MEQEEQLDFDTILNNLYFGIYQKKENQFFKEIENLNNNEKLNVFEYLISHINEYQTLSSSFLKKDKEGFLVNSNYNNTPIVIHFANSKRDSLVIDIISHKKFDIEILNKKSYLHDFVKFAKKNEAALLNLIENKPNLTLIKNLKGFKLGDRISSALEAAYLNQTIDKKSDKKTTLKI